MTDAERQQRRDQMQRAWAEGRFANRPKGRHPRAWTPPEDKMIAALAGTMPYQEIARKLTDRFGLPRTPDAVRIRAKRTGVSVYVNCWTLTQVEQFFRLDHRAVVRNWIEPGLLHATRWNGRGPNAGWWIEERDVERFIREQGWAYDWTRLPKGHRLTRLAETVHRADPWRHYEELAAYVGITKTNLDKWKRRGLVPHKRRAKGGGWWVMVRGRDFAAIKEHIEQAQQAGLQTAHQKFVAWRRAQIAKEQAA